LIADHRSFPLPFDGFDYHFRRLSNLNSAAQNDHLLVHLYGFASPLGWVLGGFLV